MSTSAGKTMLIALDFERGGEFAAEMQRLVDLVTAWAFEQPRQLPAATLRRIGRGSAYRGRQAARCQGGAAAEPRPANLEGTMARLYATEALQHHASALLDALGPAGAPQRDASAAPEAGSIGAIYRHSIVTTIYGGTSEVLRGVIAGRWLRLPRAAGTDRLASGPERQGAEVPAARAAAGLSRGQRGTASSLATFRAAA